MSGPKFRFTVMVSFIVTTCWAAWLIWAYLFGARGLNLSNYTHGASQLGLATLAGVFIVWAATRLAAAAQRGKTGFEAEVQDEYGTIFKMGAAKDAKAFPMQLSKFLPDLIAVPDWPGLSSLEAELFGFLNGYRHWPADLEAGQESLYDRAAARWAVMKDLPGAGPWHRAMALTADFGKIYAYREVRSPAALKHFWKRDRVKFVRRTREHGGLAAFVLSTLPGFRALALQAPQESQQRNALLMALRYMDDVRLLPVAVGPPQEDAFKKQQALNTMARELLDYWQKSESILNHRRGVQVMPSEAQKDELRQVIQQHLADLMVSLAPGDGPDETVDALILSQNRLLMRPTAFMSVLGRNLPTDMRQRFQLWDGAGVQHPVWPLALEIFKTLQLWPNESGAAQQGPGGRPYLLDGVMFGPVILLDFSHVPQLQHALAEFPVWTRGVEAQLGTDDVKHALAGKNEQIETLLAAQF